LNCIVVHGISYNTWTAGKEACLNDPRRQYAFTGQIPSMILSRFPIVKAEYGVLASTAFRRAILRAEIEISIGKTIDFYCLQLSPSLGGIIPYTGDYFATTDAEGWSAEERLQAKRAVPWIVEKSGKRPAIIAADFNSSPEGLPGIEPRNPRVFDPFAMFVHAVPPTWKPTCTRCKANAFGTIVTDEWTLHHYLFNFSSTAAVDGRLFHQAPVVTVSDGRKLPLADTYGLEVQILRPD
jgi:hypothetical protein